MYFMAHRRFSYELSTGRIKPGEQWDTIAPVPVGQIYRTDTLARQPVGLDDVVGKKTGLGYGCDVR